MVERLSELLRDEVRKLPVPHAPTSAVLEKGRGVRRRRRVTAAVGSAAAVLAVVAGSVVVEDLLREPPGREQLFATESYSDLGALAVDGELYVAGRRVPFDGAVKSFYYTSVGVVVRSGTSPWTDDADVDHYTLVRGDGSREALDLTTNDRIVATEPDSTRLAFADRRSDGLWDVVVIDVNSGDEVASHPIEGSFTWGGWEAPPVAIDGDLVWVHLDDGWTEVDWRSGDVREVPGTDRVHEVANGRYATWTEQGKWTVRAMDDSRVLARAELGPDAYAFFSPDGRYLRVFDQGSGLERRPSEPFIFDVDTGRRSPAPVGRDFGWTPRGDLLVIDRDGTVRTCPVGAAACESVGLRLELGRDSVVKLGGNPYES